MLMAIDIGNTNIVAGIYNGEKLVDSFRISSRNHLTSDEAVVYLQAALMRAGTTPADISKAVIASVVPRLTGALDEACVTLFKRNALIVSARIPMPITIEIDSPDQLGADRIANAVAGFAKWGGPLIVVDFGTATTFDVVDSKGTYIGGVIIPGPETAMEELAKRAARLFEVRIEEPTSVVGKSTAAALKSGLYYGTIGQIDYIIERILGETGFKNATIVATGGLASGMNTHSRFIKQVASSLTLDGLRILAG
ncbi:MAG: type III pantothenate kinase [Candidatus Zixiibacteriota bacterium]